MDRYLIDTNIVSNYFSSTFSDKGMQFLSKVIDETPLISVITQIELLSWIHKDKSKEEIIREFVGDSIVMPISAEVVNVCITIRRSRSIKTPDAIIAATAIVNKLILITG
ncbi:MAG: type II toxin-antitoxin system VapC family toxin, partial [Cytophagales bacterium]|nr:type II toxin-antitoxin system VapC family toxin [Cytophagales bacterium]